MPKELRDSVVVVTGASSGIGRATALEFARRGAAVVLAARHKPSLEEAAHACENAGGSAMVVPTDVTDEGQVCHLAQRALDGFGDLHVWVNNAAVTAFGPFEEVPADVFRRVVETNFFGCVHGSRAALGVFRERGRGTLINLSSVIGKIGIGGMSAYVSSKFAIRGLTECLRQEVLGTDIDVCLVLPAAIDTPIYQHGANYSGRTPKPINPVYPAEVVAETIVGCARRPKPEVVAGKLAYGMMTPHALSVGLGDRVARYGERGQFLKQPAPPGEGNVFETGDDWHAISGDWPHTAAPTRAALGLAAAAALLPVGWLAWKAATGERAAHAGDGEQERRG